MELRHLRYFVAVAETLHFGRAAESLHIVQPALSRQILDLEHELGLTLLARTNRSVRLTPAGAVFLAEAKAILARVRQATLRAERAERGETGRLSLGYVLSATGRPLTRILRRFRREFPEVEFVLHDLDEAEQRRRLRTGELDATLTRTVDEDPALDRLPLERGRLMLLLPAEHRLAAGSETDAIPIAELAGEAFVLGRDGDFPAYNRFLYDLCGQAGFEPRVAQRVRDLAGILWMVAAGMGIGFCSTGLEDLRRGDLVFRPLRPAFETCVWLHWRRADASPSLLRFLEVARSELAAENA